MELTGHLHGKYIRLEGHLVFPKARLDDAELSRPEVNALAKFTFLTQETNLDISDRPPEEYLPEVEAKHPGALGSH